MCFDKPNRPLVEADRPIPVPRDDQLLIRVRACGVCRTDLHIVDGDLHDPKKGVIPGHEVVGEVIRSGKDVSGFTAGQRVAVPWLGSTCGQCAYCQMGQENLCDHPRFTGYTLDGGYAQYMVADHRYCFPALSRLRAGELNGAAVLLPDLAK